MVGAYGLFEGGKIQTTNMSCQNRSSASRVFVSQVTPIQSKYSNRMYIDKLEGKKYVARTYVCHHGS